MIPTTSLSAALLALALLVAPPADPKPGPATNPATDPPTDSPVNPALPTVWIIGDSTVRNGNGKGGNGQWGWGDPLKQMFDPAKVNVINRAIGGRSSRTFLTEGRWDAILKDAKKGDFVLMQFGHNDGIAPDNKDRPRGTLRGVGDETLDIIHPATQKPETVHTFGWYLRHYVRTAKSKGVTPVVVSYIPRCPTPPPGKPISPATQPASYQLYAQQVAELEGVAYIDLFSLVLAGYSTMSADDVKEKFFTKADNTHTSLEGAKFNATKVAEGIHAKVPDLARLLARP